MAALRSFKQYQIDAFTDRLFGGNPAAVVSLEEFLPASLMQQIAAENNQAETAFIAPDEQGLAIRWFTPAVEVDLCGHATLAAGFALFELEGLKANQVFFASRSGVLSVLRRDGLLFLDFPAQPIRTAEFTDAMFAALGARPREFQLGRFGFCVFDSAAEIEALQPDFRALKALNIEAWICTAPGEDGDYCFRMFGPRVGIDEDHATGSAQCLLYPYWSARLGLPKLKSKQLSPRGADFVCEGAGDRVLIGGRCVHFSTSEIRVPI